MREQPDEMFRVKGQTGYCLRETRLGTAGLAFSAKGIRLVCLPDTDKERITRRLQKLTGTDQPATPGKGIADGIELLGRYFEGEKVEFLTVHLDLEGVPGAYLPIYSEARKLNWGELTTYGALAETLGMRGGARLVGQAMGANPAPVIIPCHRVVAASGKIGGFSAPGGSRTKQKLLEMERARLRDANGQMALDF